MSMQVQLVSRAATGQETELDEADVRIIKQQMGERVPSDEDIRAADAAVERYAQQERQDGAKTV